MITYQVKKHNDCIIETCEMVHDMKTISDKFEKLATPLYLDPVYDMSFKDIC